MQRGASFNLDAVKAKIEAARTPWPSRQSKVCGGCLTFPGTRRTKPNASSRQLVRASGAMSMVSLNWAMSAIASRLAMTNGCLSDADRD